MSGAGGSDSTTLIIGGNSAGLQQAANDASAATQRMEGTMRTASETARTLAASLADMSAQARLSGTQNTGLSATLQDLRANLNAQGEAQTASADASNVARDALTALTDAYKLATDRVNVLADAQKLGGDATATQAKAYLDAATSLDDYKARLEALSAQMDYARASQDEMSSSAGGMSFSLSGVTSALEDAAGPFGPLIGLLGQTVGQIGQFITQGVTLVATLATWTILQDATEWVHNLAEELFNLNVQTEKAVNGWQYLFGRGNLAAGKQDATSLASWSATESMNIPFTRQDLISSISSLGAKLNTQQVESFLPTIADIASTLGATAYGGQGVTLQQASRAIIMAMEGQTRMLKTDLNIDPRELIQYGLDATQTSMGVSIKDPMTLITALENFAKARGLGGAAKEQATSTWWGEWSSFQDRIQNFLLNMGGTDLSGNIRKGSLFSTLKTDLTGIANWLDAHNAQLTQIGDILGGTVASGLKAAGDAAEGLGEGLKKSGIGPDLLKMFQGLSSALGDPKKLADWKKDFENLGEGLGNAGKKVGDFLGELGHLKDLLGKIVGPLLGPLKGSFDQLKASITEFTKGMNPQEIKALKLVLGGIVALPILAFISALIVLVNIVALLITWFHFWLVVIGDLGTGIGKFLVFLGQLKDKIGSWIQDRLTDMKNWGADLLQNFIDGIISKFDGLKNAAAQGGTIVGNIFKHSTPIEGPLRGDDTWMTHMMTGYSAQIEAATPALGKSARMAAEAVSGPLGGGGGGGTSNSYSHSSSTSYATSYGNSSSHYTIHGMPSSAVQRMVDTITRRQGTASYVASHVPGGFGYTTRTPFG